MVHLLLEELQRSYQSYFQFEKRPEKTIQVRKGEESCSLRGWYDLSDSCAMTYRSDAVIKVAALDIWVLLQTRLGGEVQKIAEKNWGHIQMSAKSSSAVTAGLNTIYFMEIGSIFWHIRCLPKPSELSVCCLTLAQIQCAVTYIFNMDKANPECTLIVKHALKNQLQTMLA